MKKALFLAVAAAVVFAAPSSGRQWDSPSVKLVPTLDSRLAQLTLSGNAGALATAKSQGLLVTHGKIRVVVQARPGQVAGARAAVRLAHGKVVIATRRLIEALVPPKALRQLAASTHVAGVRPVETAAAKTVTGLRMAAFHIAAAVSGAPTEVAGDGQATVSFSPPASDGGGQTESSTAPLITVADLTNGVGTSGESEFWNAVTPGGQPRPLPTPPVGNPRPGIPSYTPSGPRPNPRHDDGREF